MNFLNVFNLLVSAIVIIIPIVYYCVAITKILKITFSRSVLLISVLALLAISFGIGILWYRSGIKTALEINSFIHLAGAVSTFEAIVVAAFIFSVKLFNKENRAHILNLLIFVLYAIAGLGLLNYAAVNSHIDIFRGYLYILLAVLFGSVGYVVFIHFLITGESWNALILREKRLKQEVESLENADEITGEVAAYKEKYASFFDKIGTALSEEKSQEALELIEQELENFEKIKAENLCENPYINAILAEKKAVCEREGIRTSFDVTLSSDVRLPSSVICSVLGNLLDNAIHACQIFDKGEKYIELIIFTKGDYVFVEQKNSANAKSQRQDAGRKHYGMSIVKAYAEKYSGKLEADWNRKEKIFVTRVMLLQDERV